MTLINLYSHKRACRWGYSVLFFLLIHQIAAQNIEYTVEVDNIEIWESECNHRFGVNYHTVKLVTREINGPIGYQSINNYHIDADGHVVKPLNQPLFSSVNFWANPELNTHSGVYLGLRAWEDGAGDRNTFDNSDPIFYDRCFASLGFEAWFEIPDESNFRTNDYTIGNENYRATFRWRYKLKTTSLKNAVDNSDIQITTGGNRGFWGTIGEAWTNEGFDAAASGSINNNQTSSMKVVVTNKSAVTFDWKVSSQLNSDFLRFYINGVEQDRISGETNFTTKTYNLTGSNNTLEWRYTKDRGGSDGNDRAFIDYIRLTDAPKPVVKTKDITVDLNTSGVVTISPEDVNNGSSSLGGIANMALDKTNFDCSNLGKHTVELTVTNNHGISASSLANVTVRDTQKPSITLIGESEMSIAYGSNYTELGTSASDNCSSSVRIGGDGVDTKVLGTYVVSYSASDASSNTSDEIFRTVHVVDDVAPVINTADLTIATDQGQNGATVGSFNITASDNAGQVELTFDTSEGSFFPIGETLVTAFAIDGSSNQSEATFIINIVDSEAPIVLTKDIMVELNASGNVSITPDLVNDGTSDNSGEFELSLNRTTFNCDDINQTVSAIQPLLLDVEENVQEGTSVLGLDPKTGYIWRRGTEGNQIDVFDGEILVETIGVGNGVSAVWIDENSEDFIYETKDSFVKRNRERIIWFSGKQVPEYTFGLTADENYVYVNERDPSSLMNKIFMYDLESGEYVKEFEFMMPFELSYSNPVYAEGILFVVGNVVSQHSYLPYNQWIPAPLHAFDAQTGALLFKSEEAVTTISNVVFDGENILNLSDAFKVFDGNVFNKSPHWVNLTATDNSGNSTTALAKVTLKDVTAPVALVKDIEVQLDVSGNVSITPEQVNDGSNDACGIASYSLSQSDFDCSNIGANEVILTVTDNNGNTSTATVNVEVQDKVGPDVKTLDVTIPLDFSGSASINVSMIDASSTDACGIATYSLSKMNFDCSNIGENEVILTVTDIHGNTSTGTAIVTVEDNIAPVVSTKNISLDLDESGIANISLSDVLISTTDNCDVESAELDQDEFGCQHLGENIVHVIVTDVNGNVTSEEAVVTINDTIAPIAVVQNITVALGADGTIVVDPQLLDGGSTDNSNCALSFSLDRDTFNCDDIEVQAKGGNGGTGKGGKKPKKAKGGKGGNGNTPPGHLVTLTVRDVAGNTDSVEAYIVVVDDMAPVFSPDPITLVVFGKKKVDLDKKDVELAVSDNCKVKSVKFPKTSFGKKDVGLHSILVEAKDDFKNVSVGIVTVNVVDISEYGDRVSMCLDNVAISVKKKDVQKYLRRGAVLGSCSNVLPMIDLTQDMDLVVDNREGASEQNIAKEVIVSLSASPNPATDKAMISFSSDMAGKAAVVVYNMQGVEVGKVFSGELEANKSVSIEFRVDNLPSGLLLVRMQTQGQVKNVKLLVRK